MTFYCNKAIHLLLIPLNNYLQYGWQGLASLPTLKWTAINNELE